MHLPPSTFRHFLFRERENRVSLLVVIGVLTIEILVFKIFYPFADFFSDSYSYIYAASIHLNVNLWPIGYSWFLRLFHQLTHADTALVVCQYFFVQLSALYFLFTVCFLLQPGTLVRRLLLCCIVFNPLSLYLSNYVSSDAIFLGVSLIWAGQLLWIARCLTWKLIWLHALVIWIAFMLRYTALYYPLITLLAVLLAGKSTAPKLPAIIIPLVGILFFVNFTRKETYKYTRQKEFSVFGGWQLVNNALYMYPYLHEVKNLPPECRSFDTLVQRYFNSLTVEEKDITPLHGSFYIKSTLAPLKNYMLDVYGTNIDSSGGIASWGSVSGVYARYGTCLISRHPLLFTRYYILPNLYNYFFPPLEKLEVYNLGTTKVSVIASSWFNYKSDRVTVYSASGQKAILFFIPATFALLNIVFVWIIVQWWVLGLHRVADKLTRNIFGLLAVLLIVNAAFSIFASPIVLRYEIFPLMICGIATAIFIEKIAIVSK